MRTSGDDSAMENVQCFNDDRILLRLSPVCRPYSGVN